MLKLIAAIALNNTIGKDGEGYFRIREDLQRFQKLTTGCPVIMGANTFALDLKGEALPNRTNVVVRSRESSVLANTGVDDFSTRNTKLMWAYTAYEALGQAIEENYYANPGTALDEPIWIIGGASIYKQFLPLVEEMYITHIYKAVNGDVYFPAVDWKEWYLKEPPDYRDGFAFAVYRRKSLDYPREVA